MERTPSSTTGNQELVDRIVEGTEEKALEEAGKTKMRVAEVASVQKKMVRDLLNDPTRSGQNDDLIAEAEQSVDDRHAERMQSIDAAPDAYVFERTDAMAGVQDDQTREVGIAHDVLQDGDAAERVSLHEGQHRKQEEGTESFTFTDAEGKETEVRRLDLRENDAIEAEGGLSNHTPEYHAYVEHSSDVAAQLDQAGENGKALVEEAARTRDGFYVVKQKLIRNSIRARLEKELKLAA